ncbi:MAG: electron transfer flavoprotein subunit beta/FixA family protein [Nitrospinaceae bacterium]|jgi:electron transfer flavoprotein beta subunit|nr:electron transfer flavoprotein subunit beta/FixA family protein [Nitrospinaceae bacterium]|tara:strand:+ start:298 stop:1086 length:789 start_codon:yes stop_codon:yes gene_type:complete
MRIVVCVKQVIDTAARIVLKDGAVDGTNLAKVLNPYDEFAVEEAIRIRERLPDTEITLISLGPEGFRDALRAGLAMGADKAVHLLNPAVDDIDSLTASRLLAKAITTLGFDLILCGRQAVDDDMAQIGPALAVYLDIPCVTAVTQLEFSDDWNQATVTRQIEGGSEIIESPLPILLTCQKGLNQPRLPSFKGIMAAKKKQIETITAEKLGFDFITGNDSTSTVIATGLKLPSLRDKGVMLDGPVSDAVVKLVKFLRDTEKVV